MGQIIVDEEDIYLLEAKLRRIQQAVSSDLLVAENARLYSALQHALGLLGVEWPED